MCRQIARPGGMKKKDVLDIMLDMEGTNTDGFGYGYVKDGVFVSKKTSMSLTNVLKKKSKDDFFNGAFEHDGWVLFHLRRASRGAVCINNSHPFVSENSLFCHNGTLNSAPLIKDLLGKEQKYLSSTDSEVAMKLYEKLGLVKFSAHLSDGGTFLSLKKDGTLHAIKTHFAADLKIAKFNKNSNKVFLSSELPVHSSFDFDDEEMSPGYLILNPQGEIIKSVEKEKTSIANPYAKHTVKHYHKTYPNVTDDSPFHESDEVKPKGIHSMTLQEYSKWQNKDWEDESHYMNYN